VGEKKANTRRAMLFGPSLLPLRTVGSARHRAGCRAVCETVNGGKESVALIEPTDSRQSASMNTDLHAATSKTAVFTDQFSTR
jgi:hypothetical protein